MRTTITIFGILLVLALAVVLVVKNLQKNQTSTDVTVMRDITDLQSSQLQAADILSLYHLDNFKWDGGHFRFVEITDVSYNKVYEVNLNAENQWMGNEFDREKTVKEFSSSILKTLNSVQTVTPGKNMSSVYLPVVTELNRLSGSSSKNRIIIIYSDLMENTLVFSMYTKKNLDILKTHPESIRKYFEAMAPLKNLYGIKVHLIYEPNDNAADQVYKSVAGIYKGILENKGAVVEISANIN